jgi:hypothetical protein
MWFLVMGTLFCALALLACGTVMNWPADAITAARVGLILFASANILMELIERCS